MSNMINPDSREFGVQVLKNRSRLEECFREVADFGILTPEEKETLLYFGQDQERLDEYLRENLSITPNEVFECPRYIHKASSFSGEELVIRIPTARMQIILRLILNYFKPLIQLGTDRFSFGEFGRKNVLLMEEAVRNFINSGEFRCGFICRFEIFNSGYYRNTLREHLPIPEWLTDKLIESGNLSSRELIPETGSLLEIPCLEECAIHFWFPELLLQVRSDGMRLLRYRNNLLVLSKGRRKLGSRIEQVRRELHRFGVQMDYETLKTFDVSEGFSFLGKRYRFEDGKAACEPEASQLYAFLEFVRRILECSLDTFPEKEEEINRLIFVLNTYHGHYPDWFQSSFYGVLITSLYEKSSKKTYAMIEDETETEGGCLTLNKIYCRGLSDFEKYPLLSREQNERQGIPVPEDCVCPVCGKSIENNETAELLKIGSARTWAHKQCLNNIPRILEHLDTTYDFDFTGYALRAVRYYDEKRNFPEIKANWIYYPLYRHFYSLKSRTVSITFSEMEEILGFELRGELKSSPGKLRLHDQDGLRIGDSWRKAGYDLKTVDPEKGILTFERTEPNYKYVTTNPIMKLEIPGQVQRDFDSFLESLLKSVK